MLFSMKAIVQTGPEAVEVQDRPKPVPGPDEVLVQVHSAGICGSDVHAYLYEDGYQWIPIPRVMGHEYSGTVVEVGENVSEFAPDDRVVEEPIHDCGECFQCTIGQPNVCQDFSITGMHRDGAYTEYTLVDPQHLHPVPDGVSLDVAALTEPTSIATRAVLDRSNVTGGDVVLVQGPGPIGVLTACVARAVGARAVVSGLAQDAEHRLPVLENMGFETVTVDVDGTLGNVEEQTVGGGFDAAFDTTGHHSGIEQAIDYTRKGGEIVIVGLPGSPSELFMTPFVRNELEVNASYGSTYKNFEQALRLMQQDSIQPEAIMDTSFGTDEPERAFEACVASRTIKPVFRFA